MRKYTDSQLLNRVKEIGGEIVPGKYLIIGVRSLEDQFNKMDDKFYLYLGGEFVLWTPGTTNPGKNALLNFEAAGLTGAAVLKTDEFYSDAFTNGKHRGRMDALRQNVPFKYYRDDDGDDKAEEIGKIYSGIIWTNFHGVDYDPESDVIKTDINGWSYGCQVAADMTKYREIIKLTKANPFKIDFALLKEFTP